MGKVSIEDIIRDLSEYIQQVEDRVRTHVNGASSIDPDTLRELADELDELQNIRKQLRARAPEVPSSPYYTPDVMMAK